MKGLDDVSALERSPSLEEFIHTSALNMQPAQYEGLLKLPILKGMLVGFGSNKRKQAFEAEMEKAGIEGFSHSSFDFR